VTIHRALYGGSNIRQGDVISESTLEAILTLPRASTSTSIPQSHLIRRKENICSTCMRNILHITQHRERRSLDLKVRSSVLDVLGIF
jgi:hypothetical protein